MSGSGKINLHNAVLPADIWKGSNSIEPKALITPIGRPIIDINKNFLVNTIQNVESHNRFEEVQSCWRHKGLDEKYFKRKRLDSDGNNHVKADQDLQRLKWAEKKAQTQAIRELLPDVTYSSSSSGGFGGGKHSLEAPPSHGLASDRSAASFALYSSEENSCSSNNNSDSERKSRKDSKDKKKRHKKESKKESKKHKKHKKEMKFDVKLKESTVEKLKDSSS